MADTPNLYQELKDALQEFKDFLDDNVPKIKDAILALGSMFPKLKELIGQLIDLMGDLKEEIDKLDVTAVPGLEELSKFTAGVTTLLTTAKSLLPDKAGTIDQVLGAVNVVGSLPSLGDVKDEIKTLIDAIVVHLTTLKG
jgi:phage-related minor tail protein